MGLFRPYERTTPDASKKRTTLTSKQPAPPTTSEPVAPAPSEKKKIHREKKGQRTPTRKQAEAARMERLHPTLSRSGSRKKERAARRAESEKNWKRIENSPERVLLRNYVDARWTITEFVFPMMLVFLAATMAVSYRPQFMIYVSVGLWVFLIANVVNIYLLWRGYKVELATRYPKASTRGSLSYLMNRAMMIRRFRHPRPVIARKDSY